MVRALPPLEFTAPSAPDNAELLIGTRLYVVRDHAHDVRRPWCIRLATTHFGGRSADDVLLADFNSPGEAKSALKALAAGLCSFFDNAWPASTSQANEEAPLVPPTPRAQPSRFIPFLDDAPAKSTPLDDFDVDALLAEQFGDAPTVASQAKGGAKSKES